MKNILLFIIMLAIGLGYIIWLNSGCEYDGVMTWQGKVCFEDLETK